MWSCPSCGNQVNDASKFCTSCGTSQSYPTQSQPLLPQPVITHTPSIEPLNSPYAASAVKRYRDAYRVARVINGIGQGIKLFGVFISLVFILVTLALIDQRGQYVRVGVLVVGISIIVAITLLFFWVVGVFVAAKGQRLKISIDGAVQGSRFLNDDQRAQAMSL